MCVCVCVFCFCSSSSDNRLKNGMELNCSVDVYLSMSQGAQAETDRCLFCQSDAGPSQSPSCHSSTLTLRSLTQGLTESARIPQICLRFYRFQSSILMRFRFSLFPCQSFLRKQYLLRALCTMKLTIAVMGDVCVSWFMLGTTEQWA